MVPKLQWIQPFSIQGCHGDSIFFPAMNLNYTFLFAKIVCLDFKNRNHKGPLCHSNDDWSVKLPYSDYTTDDWHAKEQDKAGQIHPEELSLTNDQMTTVITHNEFLNVAIAEIGYLKKNSTVISNESASFIGMKTDQASDTHCVYEILNNSCEVYTGLYQRMNCDHKPLCEVHRNGACCKDLLLKLDVVDFKSIWKVCCVEVHTNIKCCTIFSG